MLGSHHASNERFVRPRDEVAVRALRQHDVQHDQPRLAACNRSHRSGEGPVPQRKGFGEGTLSFFVDTYDHNILDCRAWGERSYHALRCIQHGVVRMFAQRRRVQRGDHY
jgi:hypothetical protein